MSNLSREPLRLLLSLLLNQEKSAEWSELFLDLVMVAACSNVAEEFEEDFTWRGLRQFVIVFQLMLSGWLNKTALSSRFTDNSLVTDMSTYVYFLGLSMMAMNPIPGNVFTVAAIVQRVGLLCLYLPVLSSLEETSRDDIKKEVSILVGSICFLFISLAVGSPLAVLFFVWALEVPSNLWVTLTLGFRSIRLGRLRTPINIDHFSERQSCMVMVVLGESVVSAVMNTKELSDPAQMRLLVGVAPSLLISYYLATMYYAIVPTRETHAQRRSCTHGVAYVLIHQLLFQSLLGVGVGTKFATTALTTGSHLGKSKLCLLFFSAALSIFSIFMVRFLHFWGREPFLRDLAWVRRTKNIWWGCAICSPLLPIIGLFSLRIAYPTKVDPNAAFTVLAISILIFVFLEHVITTILSSALSRIASAQSEASTDEEEGLSISSLDLSGYSKGHWESEAELTEANVSLPTTCLFSDYGTLKFIKNMPGS